MRDQWKTRRRMAIFAFVAGLIIFPIAYVFFPSLEKLSIVYYSLISIVLAAYYSLTTINDIKGNKKDDR